MDYRLTFEELDKINAERAARGARCEGTGCGESVAAMVPMDLNGEGPRFLCDRHAEWEADELAARDLDDIKLQTG